MADFLGSFEPEHTTILISPLCPSKYRSSIPTPLLGVRYSSLYSMASWAGVNFCSLHRKRKGSRVTRQVGGGAKGGSGNALLVLLYLLRLSYVIPHVTVTLQFLLSKQLFLAWVLVKVCHLNALQDRILISATTSGSYIESSYLWLNVELLSDRQLLVG